MAYENMTYERLMQRMLDRVTEKYPNLDTREGSIIFNALAPAAFELAVMYNELDNVLSESFVSTASREYLLTACKQMGIDTSVFNSSYGVHKGVFNAEVPIDSRWNHDLYNYTVTEYIGVDENGHHEYRMMCETAGEVPNVTTGDLTPITYINNEVTYAKVTECLIEGEDESPDEDIRVAYYDRVNSAATDGNIKQYERWCSEYKGVGNYKIEPRWNGDNTVKVYILSASNGVASEELIDEFQEYLDPGSTGMGDGVAPIGAVVTVDTAEEYPITITANVKMLPGYSDTTAINRAVSEYLASISYKKSVVAYMTIGATILSVDGVESINNLQLNGAQYDIVLDQYEIPVLDNATWVVV